MGRLNYDDFACNNTGARCPRCGRPGGQLAYRGGRGGGSHYCAECGVEFNGRGEIFEITENGTIGRVEKLIIGDGGEAQEALPMVLQLLNDLFDIYKGQRVTIRGGPAAYVQEG